MKQKEKNRKKKQGKTKRGKGREEKEKQREKKERKGRRTLFGITYKGKGTSQFPLNLSPPTSETAPPMHSHLGLKKNQQLQLQ